MQHKSLGVRELREERACSSFRVLKEQVRKKNEQEMGRKGAAAPLKTFSSCSQRSNLSWTGISGSGLKNIRASSSSCMHIQNIQLALPTVRSELNQNIRIGPKNISRQAPLVARTFAGISGSGRKKIRTTPLCLGATTSSFFQLLNPF
jgi:hypothetical protein